MTQYYSHIPATFDPTPSAPDLHSGNASVFEVAHSVGANGKLIHISHYGGIDADVVGISWATDELEYRGSGLTAPIKYILGQRTWTPRVGPFSLRKEGAEWKLSLWTEDCMVYEVTIRKVQFVNCNQFRQAPVLLLGIQANILHQMGEWKDVAVALMIACSLVEVSQAVVAKGTKTKL